MVPDITKGWHSNKTHQGQRESVSRRVNSFIMSVNSHIPLDYHKTFWIDICFCIYVYMKTATSGPSFAENDKIFLYELHCSCDMIV